MKHLRRILELVGIPEIYADYTTLGKCTLFPVHVLGIFMLLVVAMPVIYTYVLVDRYIAPLFFKPKAKTKK